MSQVPTMTEMRPFTEALYLQGRLTALLGLSPDATVQEVEKAVLELVRRAAK